ncbi:inactive Ufm1-specific protease 1, partial [Cebus imitator]|uniref:inactive Ufm1-specific protease 1 n=1 Tax=Cebus imitator TaxID=2715852 RepID=UPI00080A3F70
GAERRNHGVRVCAGAGPEGDGQESSEAGAKRLRTPAKAGPWPRPVGRSLRLRSESRGPAGRHRGGEGEAPRSVVGVLAGGRCLPPALITEARGACPQPARRSCGTWPKTRSRGEVLESAVVPRRRVDAVPGLGLPLPPTALELLRDVHVGLAPPSRGPARLALLSGHYLYYHYGCDGLDDRGWGCGYRTLQTLCSWPEGQPEGVPGLAAVQAALEDLGDKPPGFRGSQDWIGCVEASLCLAHFGETQGRLCHVPRGAGLHGELERLYSHFAGGGGPVMVGGDADARSKALLGVCIGSGTEAYVLVLDPHYWGAPKSPSELQAAGWVGWREINEAFDPNSFYNLCLTSHSSEQQQHPLD